MKNILKQVSQVFLIGWGLSVTCSLAQPSIDGISSPNDEVLKHDAVLALSGSGFDDKETAAPILFDQVDHAYEYGDLNEVHSSLGNMSEFPTSSDNPDAIWGRRTPSAYFATDYPKRHQFSGASYFLEGNNASFGLPSAYGGWDTPTDNPQLYVAWWYKNKVNSTYYWRFTLDQKNGNFIDEEVLKVNGQEAGTYVGTDSDGLHNAVLKGHRNANNLKGMKISGKDSGAQGIFPENFRGGSGSGYETPGSKLARIWDDPNGSDGIRSSIALHDFYVSPSRDGFSRATVYDNLLLPEDEWVHLEYELDTDQGIVRMFEDGRFRGEASFDPEAIYQGAYSPTLSLIGTNGKNLKLQESEISELYIDSSLQRVVLGNASKYSEVTHRELQLPLSWTDSEVVIQVHGGGLDLSDNIYAYVFDSDGVVNENGLPLCDFLACMAAPERVDLKVE